MLEAALCMCGVGFLSSVGLAIASRVFRVEQDPRIDQVLDALPGANCGGCGQAGCGALAELIVAGKADPGSCVAGGPDVATNVGAVMGMAVTFIEPKLALGHCKDSSRSPEAFAYSGAMDCRAAAMLHGGQVGCSTGCLGFGSCVQSCPFDAIEMGPDGVPVFDAAACRGCVWPAPGRC